MKVMRTTYFHWTIVATKYGMSVIYLSFTLAAASVPSLNLSFPKITAFTLPYFALTEQPPAADSAPLSPSGIFGVSTKGNKYIREEKFSLSWSGEANEPSLMLALNPLSQIDDNDEYQSKAVNWIRNNIFLMRCRWEEVFDAIDEQTTLSV